MFIDEFIEVTHGKRQNNRLISLLAENNQQISALNRRSETQSSSLTFADEQRTSQLYSNQADFFSSPRRGYLMAIKMQESVNYIAEMNAKANEMDTEGFESTELVECAFRELREVLPLNESRENLSDLDVLKLAMEYIHNLEELLHYETRNSYH